MKNTRYLTDLSSVASIAEGNSGQDRKTGQFPPESVVKLLRNAWSVSSGISGQFAAESVVSLVRNTHPPDIKEKIIALTVLNRLLKKDVLNTEFRPLTYDFVTAFVETYFIKPNTEPVLRKLTALAAKRAYKDAVEEYFLTGFDRQELNQSIVSLERSFGKKNIDDENDLLEIIVSVLSDILAHHIENRHWIDAFWDGERQIKFDGKEIRVPRQPKKETEIQPTLHVVLDMALSPFGIQVVRESNEGIGFLDFRCLHTIVGGKGISVGIEFKLAPHKELRKGIQRQLPAYLKAIRSQSGVFSVMWFKDGKIFKEPHAYEKEKMAEWLKKEAVEASSENKIKIITSLIDASIKHSASNL